jgi:hypothetical protein
MLDQRTVPEVQLLDPAGADDLEEEASAAPGYLHYRPPAGSVGTGADLNGPTVHTNVIEERTDQGRIKGLGEPGEERVMRPAPDGNPTRPVFENCGSFGRDAVPGCGDEGLGGCLAVGPPDSGPVLDHR